MPCLPGCVRGPPPAAPAHKAPAQPPQPQQQTPPPVAEAPAEEPAAAGTPEVDGGLAENALLDATPAAELPEDAEQPAGAAQVHGAEDEATNNDGHDESVDDPAREPEKCEAEFHATSGEQQVQAAPGDGAADEEGPETETETDGESEGARDEGVCDSFEEEDDVPELVPGTPKRQALANSLPSPNPAEDDQESDAQCNAEPQAPAAHRPSVKEMAMRFMGSNSPVKAGREERDLLSTAKATALDKDARLHELNAGVVQRTRNTMQTAKHYEDKVWIHKNVVNVKHF